MKKFLFVVAALAVSGCSHEKPVVVSAPVPEQGKRTAPVAIEAAVQDGAAKLTLTFEGAGEDVTIDVAGRDGLSVKGAPVLLERASVPARDTKAFDIGLARGAGRNALVISVKGTFSGAPLMRVVTFTLGEGPLQQSGVKLVSDEGQAFKVMQVPTPGGESGTGNQ